MHSTLTLADPAATDRLARAIAPHLGAGDFVGLTGGLGAGKSLFARALIGARLAALGRAEDVPSPSYTLVQTYDLGAVELWHADLYRLGGAGEIAELGLEEAFATAICLVEWADRLGPALPRAPADAGARLRARRRRRAGRRGCSARRAGLGLAARGRSRETVAA